MSATDNQAARKGEFNQVVEEQLRKGIYEMRRVEISIGRPATQPSDIAPQKIMATEIVKDEKGVPVIAAKSPLEEYGITIQQFSITGTTYDELTNQQFAAKQKSFLAAEASKAEREQEVQKKLMVEAQGERKVAEITAEANSAKAKVVTEAKQKAEVAEQEKKAAEVLAEQKVAVAKLDKQAAETKAEQEVMIAKKKAEQAEQEALATITLAKAEQEKIKLAGALSEKDKMTLELTMKRDVAVAEAMSKINVPSTIIAGAGAGDGKANLTEQLMNFAMLRSLGFLKELPPMNVPTTQPVK